MILKRNLFCAAALLLLACGEPAATNTSNIVITSYIAEAQDAAKETFGSKLAFVEIYENKSAVCGTAKKGEGEARQFIFDGQNFILEENFEPAQWEEQWFSQCDDG